MKSCCHTHSLKYLNEIALSIKNNFSKTCAKELNSMYYGYDNCGADSENLEELKTLSKVLDRQIKRSILDQKSPNKFNDCLTCNELEYLLEKIRKIIGKSCSIDCSDLLVDDSYEETWILNNVNCVSYECWNKWSKLLNSKLDVKLTTEKQRDFLLLEISRKTIPSQVLVAISTITEANKLDLRIDRSLEESKIDFEILNEQITVDFDFKTYNTFTKNNLSFEVIKEVYKNNLSLVLENGGVYLQSSLEKYPIDKLDLNLSYLKKADSSIDLDISRFLKDYTK